MSKYIDLSVKTDIQVDTIKQSTLKIGSESVTIIPTSEADSTLQYESGSWKYTNHGVSKELSKTLLPSSNRISFTGTDLVNGKLTIKHNLGFKYLLGLDYTVMPKNITFVDENTLELDYSDQPSTVSGDVWFILSQQNMLSQLAQTIKQGLIANWSLNESSDQNTAQDDLGKYPLTSNGSSNLDLYGGKSGVIGTGWSRGSFSRSALSAVTTISADEYKDAYTFNIWMMFPSGYSGSAAQLIGIDNVQFDSESNRCVGLYGDSYGIARFVPVYWSGTMGSEDASVSGRYNLDEWTMVTGTYANKNAKLYINGALVSQKTFDDVPSTNGYLTLFGNSWNHNNGLRLDVASFWNKELTSDEIAFLYNGGKGYDPYSGASGDGTSLNFPSDDLILSIVLDSRDARGGDGGWSLTESYSGNTFGFQDGIPCIYKTNSYGAFKLTPVNKLPTGESPFTVSFWSKCTVGGSEPFNITWGASDAGSGAFYIATSETAFTVVSWSPNSTIRGISARDIDGTKWHHYALRYTDVGPELWVDGVKKTAQEGRYSIKPEYCTISGRYWASHGEAFTGAMSSLRIYGRALSESEIQALAKEFTPTA